MVKYAVLAVLIGGFRIEARPVVKAVREMGGMYGEGAEASACGCAREAVFLSELFTVGMQFIPNTTRPGSIWNTLYLYSPSRLMTLASYAQYRTGGTSRYGIHYCSLYSIPRRPPRRGAPAHVTVLCAPALTRA